MKLNTYMKNKKYNVCTTNPDNYHNIYIQFLKQNRSKDLMVIMIMMVMMMMMMMMMMIMMDE